MLDQDQINTLFDKDLYGSDGESIGGVPQVYTDDQSGQPEWLTVSTGLFGSKESFVPLADADLSGDRVTVPFSKAHVKDAPNVDEDGHLSPDRSSSCTTTTAVPTTTALTAVRLTRRPSFADNADDRVGADVTAGTTHAEGGRSVGHDTSGPTTDDAMTVSEEQLQVGTERREAGRARLRKYVVTENVTQTVPVSHEEVRHRA